MPWQLQAAELKTGPQVAFRVDASARIGTGHVVRCLTLADSLRERGARTRFVCRSLPEVMRARLERHGHELSRLDGFQSGEPVGELAHSHWLTVSQDRDAEDTLQALADRSWDWVIVDHYALDERWETILRQAAKNMMVIDDLADRQHDCDLLLDQNLVSGMNERYVGRVPATCRTLLGPLYALLHRGYAELHAVVAPRVAVKRVLIFFGGTDPDNLTGRALNAVLSLERKDISIDVVLSVSSPYSDEVEALARRHSQVTCHRNLPTLAPLIASADLALGSLGATSWERLCLGLPTIAISMAMNQKEVATALDRGGLVDWIGHSDSATTEAIATHLKRALEREDLSAWSARCREVCDGRGTWRTIEGMNDVGALKSSVSRAATDQGEQGRR